MAKIFSVPEECPAPEWVPGMDWQTMERNENEHYESLKSHVHNMGYNKPYSGEKFMLGHADGYAQYMFIDAGGKNWGLIHLPYGDGWNSPNAKHYPKKAIIDAIKSEKKFQKAMN